MMQSRRIVLATPHSRYDELETGLRDVHGLDVVRIREPAELTAGYLVSLQPSWVFLPHWSLVIPPSVYEAFECVVFHMTDLPFGRGGSPLQNLIISGMNETKLSAIRCAAALDAGPVYCKRQLSLAGSAEQIFARAARLMEGMVVQIVRENTIPVPQVGEPTIFKRRTPDQSDIARLTDLDLVYNHIRMLDAEGYPKAFLVSGALRLEFVRADHHGDHVRAEVTIRTVPGEIP